MRRPGRIPLTLKPWGLKDLALPTCSFRAGAFDIMPSSTRTRKVQSLSSGESSAGKAVRIVDIAERVGVSSRVVSKVLFPGSFSSARVGKATAEKVRAVASELGYLPNLTARQLAGARSRMFGVLVHSFIAETSYKVLAYIEQQASKHGYRLLVGQLHGDAELTEQFIEDFAGRGLDGVVSFVHENPSVQGRLRELCRPIQNMIFVGAPAVSWADWVGADLAEGLRMVVRHLYDSGRRRIALLQPESVMAPYHERLRGFATAIDSLSLRHKDCPAWLFDPGLVSGTQQYQIHDAVRDLLEAHPRIDAIIAVNDLAAMYVLQYLHGRATPVPDQIAVTGFDNLDMAQAAIPPVTSVDQCPKKVAEKVIELLLQRVNDPGRVAQSVLITPELILRGSSASS